MQSSGTAESVSKVGRVPFATCDEYATVDALANGRQITHRFDAVCDPDTGREQPTPSNPVGLYQGLTPPVGRHHRLRRERSSEKIDGQP